jgi:hypothetical protein
MTVLHISDYAEKQKLRQELSEWRRRLKLCYEYEWKDPSLSICLSEVKRLKEEIGEETILEKIQKIS